MDCTDEVECSSVALLLVKVDALPTIPKKYRNTFNTP